MKRKILFLMFSVLYGLNVNAQTYSSWGVSENGYDYDTLTMSPDTLLFTFSGIEAGGWGDARLVVYFEGDYSSSTEYLAAFETSSLTVLGTAATNQSDDCLPEDSNEVVFLTADLMNWQVANVFSVKIATTSSVSSTMCFNNRVKVRLEYNYCSFGTPVDYADFTVDTNVICPHSVINLTGSPAGGSFTGTNVSGSVFSPSGLAIGNYDITYVYTDGIGCITDMTKSVSVLGVQADQSFLVCKDGDSPALSGVNTHFIYGDDYDFSNPIDTGAAYIYGQVNQSPTYIYAAPFSPNGYFDLDTIYNTGSMVIDHDNLTGDDRGGIAVTPNYVFVTGDDASARYDLNLQNGIILPLRDGLFSNLQNGRLWSLYNSVTSQLPNGSSPFDVDAIIALDDMLMPTSEVIILSQTITMQSGGNSNGILAGYGVLGLTSGDNDQVYLIDLGTGLVTDLGVHSISYYGSENWADWGVIGSDGSDYFAYYRGGTDNIERYNLTTDVVTDISDFTDISDWSSFTYSPINNRVYFHYEDNGQFGGASETLGYVDADATIILLPGGEISGCPFEIEFTFNTVDLGNDTTVCDYNTPFILEAGFGYESYTWNGDNNNWNIYPVSNNEEVILEVVDAANCVIIDTINVLVDGCLGIENLSHDEFALYPNPNNGTFNVQFGTTVSEVEIRVVDMTGKLSYFEKFDSVQKVKVETEKLETGLYIIYINTGENAYQTTFIVE